MSTFEHREPYIPLRLSELIDVLASDADLTESDRDGFRRVCHMVRDIHHHQCERLLEKLKADYAPFDPDADTHSLATFSAEERQQRLNDLFHACAAMLQQADYRYLNSVALEPAMEGSSEWGLHTDVDFRIFERLAIFARGNTVEKRTVRRWHRRWKIEEVEVPIYRRLVMVMKLRQHQRLGRQVDTNMVYFQLFKNIPQLDVNMVLPGARVRMTKLDRGKIGLPLLGGLAMALWQLVRDMLQTILHWLNDILLFKPAAIWAAASGAFGYGFKSYYGYQQTRQRYNMTLMQMLYFQNLDTNAGVFHRLFDEADDQRCREIVLAFHSLWRHAGQNGWTGQELKQFVEKELFRRADVHVDFEWEEGLQGLEKLHLLKKSDDRYHSVSLEDAKATLAATWNGLFSQPHRQVTTTTSVPPEAIPCPDALAKATHT